MALVIDREIACAIVGIGGRFAGASDVPSFWRNLLDGNCLSREHSRETLLSAGVSPVLVADPRFVPFSATLEHPFHFDASLFKITPGDAELMDPQQRLFLQCAWSALESAGVLASPPEGRRIGVFASVSASKWNVSRYAGSEEMAGDLGTMSDFVATRAAYHLDLRGPAMTISTGCSSSLVAIHVALTSLLSNECDVAIAGGAAVRWPVRRGHIYESGGVYSKDGFCRPYDAQSTGTVSGDGAGVVALKRLVDAERDGDHIHAVVLGSAVNNDGCAKSGFVAPSVSGQVAVISSALQMAGIEPLQIGFIEGHGTGTPLGDPIEVAALAKVWDGCRRDMPTILGSVKSNLGHLDSASGVASLIKATLSVKHGVVPATVFFRSPNPELNLAGGPFEVSAQNSPLRERVALVQNLGLGGTNASVVVAAYDLVQAPRSISTSVILPVSARSVAGAADSLATLEKEETSRRAVAGFTLVNRRSTFDVRGALVQGADGLVQRLEPRRRLQAPRIVFAAPSFSAWHSRAIEFIGDLKIFRFWLSTVEIALRNIVGLGFAEIAADDTYERTFPASVGFGVAVGRTLADLGVGPQLLMGQSLGEITAAVLANVMSTKEGLRLARCRGQLVATTVPGTTLAITAGVHEIEEDMRLYDDYSVAVVAGPQSCVVSGTPEAIEKAARRFEAMDIATHVLPIRVAAHSNVMDPIRAAFEAECAAIRMTTPDDSFLSSLDGRPVGDRVHEPSYWGEHLRRTNRWDLCLEALTDQDIVVDLGPGRSLTTSLRQSRARVVGAMPHPDAEDGRLGILSAVGQLWCEGADIAWDRVGVGSDRMVEAPIAPLEEKAVATPEIASSRPQNESSDLGLWTVRWTTKIRAEKAERRQVAVLGDGTLASALRSAITVGSAQTLAGIDDADVLIICAESTNEDSTLRQLMAAEKEACLVTSSAFDVAMNGNLSPRDAAFQAFATVMSQERTSVSLRCVDVEDNEALSLETLLDEVLERNGPRIKAIRGRQIFVPDVANVGLSTPVKLRDGGVYLLIGGLGRFGRAVARKLAASGAGLLVFLGRTGVSNVPERQAAIVDIERYGTRVEIVQGDATQASSITSVLSKFPGGVDGVIHFAADLEDKSCGAPLVDFQADEFAASWQRQMSPKLDVAESLASAMNRYPVGFVCQFSSNASLLGGLGLAFYSAANAAVDAFAVNMARHGHSWVSIRWDGWKIKTEKDYALRSGLERYSLLDDVAFDLMLRAINSGLRVVSAVKGDLSERWRTWVEGAGRGVLERSSAQISDGAPYAQWNESERLIAQYCEELLGEPVPDPDANLIQLGLQSLALMRLRLRLRAETSSDLTLSQIMAKPTVSAIARATLKRNLVAT